MKFVSVSYHLPDPDGSAAGRVLFATVEGLRAEGHDVAVTCWRPEPPQSPLPSWCTWVPFPARSGWAGRAAGLLRPRNESAALDVDVPAGAVVFAEEFLSHPAVAGHDRVGLTVHNSTSIDVRVVGRPSGRDLQNARAERRAVRRAPLVLASSARVAGALPARARVVPVGYPIPASPLAAVDEPVAATLADWRWPPNRWALDRLVAAWPEVRARVPGARLLLAGEGSEQVAGVPGVEGLGRVGSSADVLARAAAVTFPCPATTGPKIKVLEAVASGLPVVTTRAGVEGLGLRPGEGAVVTDVAGFAVAVADLLVDGERRRHLADAGRERVATSHGPRAAARARVAACLDALGPAPG